MVIKQISIFLENAAGRLAEVTRVLKEGNINLRAIMIADTADFGILRIIADEPERAIEVLKKAQFTVKTTDVLSLTVEDKVGSLADVLALFEQHHINIEYLYAALEQIGETAVVVFRMDELEKAVEVIKASGLAVLDTL